MEEEAVSPVIAVILMVAITVVLAATVFVLVSDIGGQQSAPPSINFQTNEAQDQLVVNSADSRADWSRLEVSATTGVVMGTCDTSQPSYSCVSTAAGTGATVGAGAEAPASDAAVIRAGDYLEFCDSTDQQVSITIVDVTANAKVGDWVFTELADC